MRITVEPTIHDSAYVNGEDKRGEMDWLRHGSASADFSKDQETGENPFSVLHKLLLTTGHGKETADAWLTEAGDEIIFKKVDYTHSKTQCHDTGATSRRNTERGIL